MDKFYLLALLVLPSAASAAVGSARIQGTAEGSPISGSVAFEDTTTGLKIDLSVAGLTPGRHGFHIHEWGDCSDMGKAAGGHYNPAHAMHGQALKSGPLKAHAGDTGNLAADQDGRAKLEVVLPGVKLTQGEFTVAGRAVIIHEKADDFSQPVGNAGGRVACGLIGLVPGQTAAPK